MQHILQTQYLIIGRTARQFRRAEVLKMFLTSSLNPDRSECSIAMARIRNAFTNAPYFLVVQNDFAQEVPLSENANSHDAASASPTALPTIFNLSRRKLLGVLGGLSLQSCSPTVPLSEWQLDEITTGSIVRNIGFGAREDYDRIYGTVNDDGFLLPAIPYQKIKARYRRQEVVDPTGETEGSIVVLLQQKQLYYVLPGGRAVRYGVGVGKDGFRWSGRAVVQYKKKWPTWTPPEEMLLRRPDLVQYRSGMAPGLTNPLGARALYIFKDGVDTLFRIHGSPEWWTIGQAMSSGCIRMLNQDIIDLYQRARPGAPILVG